MITITALKLFNYFQLLSVLYILSKVSNYIQPQS